MQNLTAHYNILFNANELLRQKQEAYALAFIDNYGDFLNVYQDTIARTPAPDKDLDAVIVKANLIINEKEQSHYLADAYLLLAKANFLNANYFNASEFCSYVIHSFPTNTKLVQEAAIWKARSLLYLNNLSEAKLTLDSAFLKISYKNKVPADLYAAKLQYDINTRDYADGEQMAKGAIHNCDNKNQRLRWTFILGQLQELEHKNKEAIVSYINVTKSNAAFEMAFNANLNAIRIQDEVNGIKVSRIDRLLSLLKNQNNIDFTDQIYYQVAEIYFLNNDIDNAIKNYKLSIRTSNKNQNQKGLSYLRIADIDFKNKADYVSAKKYYDSTLTNLSPNYPGYLAIQKKNNNLKLLVDRLHIIGHEDTLQMLAKLDEKTRQARIDAMVSGQVLQQQTVANNSAIAQANVINNAQNPVASVPNGRNFYFYNLTAVSQGYSDFKRKWGDRKLDDDWRRSSRTNTNNPAILNTGQVVSQSNDPNALPANQRRSRTDVAAGNYRQQLLQDLPLTPQLLAGSNARIYGAYLDIANFYRDILDDKKEAIATFLLVLNKFPDDPNKASIYYSLYRLYSDLDAAKSEYYKSALLKQYPETAFARVIADPDYARHLDDKDVAFNVAYNQVYDLYAQRKYAQVISNADELLKQYPLNQLSVQLYYLRALAAGHQEKLEPFQADLQQIAQNYPNDQLITPLVKQHLAYIEANKTELSAQNFALTDAESGNELFVPPIVYQKETAFRRPVKPDTATLKPVDKRVPQSESAKTAAILVDKSIPTKSKTAVKNESTLFSLRDSTHYFFVVNVSMGRTDLSSSRFGIGQFNRANYPAGTITHQLKSAGPDNQLIYIGRFSSLADVKQYARAIIPVMPDIMKVPKDKYSFFIITQENLDKLADKKLLDSYFDYYQQTY